MPVCPFNAEKRLVLRIERELPRDDIQISNYQGHLSVFHNSIKEYLHLRVVARFNTVTESNGGLSASIFLVLGSAV